MNWVDERHSFWVNIFPLLEDGLVLPLQLQKPDILEFQNMFEVADVSDEKEVGRVFESKHWLDWLHYLNRSDLEQ